MFYFKKLERSKTHLNVCCPLVFSTVLAHVVKAIYTIDLVLFCFCHVRYVTVFGDSCFCF